MRASRFTLFVLLTILLTAGCATGSGTAADPGAQPEQQQAEEDDGADTDADATADSEADAAPEAEADHDGFDARLSSYEYPYEVEIFEVDAQRQTLEMAYMDVQPENPNGKTVLLLHGKNFSGAYWKTTIEALTDEGYRVVAPDQIGFGKSSKPRTFQFSFHALATYTKALLDELGVDRTAVVGHSMGGMLATRFALMFPDTTTKLALVNPIGLEDWKRKVPYTTIDQWYARELKKTPEKIQAYMTESYFDGVWKEAYEPLVEIQAGWTKGPDYERVAWNSALAYDMIFTQPVLYEFGDINAPTLLIIGQRDRTALGKGDVSAEVRKTLGNYPELGRAAAEAIPDAKLVEFDAIGHIPQFEAYDRYISALEGFLAADSAADSATDTE
ncbi:alpha/beta hydrolase [Persicimonas caeni]|uniref:Alpha/beta hydrolase n=1 Tax=Persicimonas caeni TaxID=2292766 RepID=A0A4Y6PQA6_PERCE|nr:alpha/beta hydrolase [Persicimonas caeni]QDG50516.1 alpha/beta hydrolase [Persicimonas caeni]QED31737.1 alpha/beta hydrolase [Persicimonas caeni]